MTYHPLADGLQLAERLAVERRRRGWSTRELGRRMTEAGCEVPPNAVSRIERHERDLSVMELVALSRVFDLPVSDLLAPAEWLRQKQAEGLLLRARANDAALVGAVRELVELVLEVLFLADEDEDALEYLHIKNGAADATGDMPDTAVGVELPDGTTIAVEVPVGEWTAKLHGTAIDYAVQVRRALTKYAEDDPK
jgi:transcriptional regulator with XRE-family HTH domain